MSKLYIISPINYEYNDETYFSAGYGQPKLVFTSKEEAKSAVEDLTIKEFLHWANLGEAHPSLMTGNEAIDAVLIENFKLTGNLYYIHDSIAWKNVTAEQFKFLIAKAQIEIYIITEVNQ